jgi:hypothetical protein
MAGAQPLTLKEITGGGNDGADEDAAKTPHQPLEKG